MRSLTVTLKITLEDEEGRPVSTSQVRQAAVDAEEAIRNRLMGEGFLAPDVLVGSYTIDTAVSESTADAE